MEIRQLQCFVAAAETLHFGEAARRIGVLPAVLGRHVQTLETALRTRLFRRSTRQVALTDAGRLLLPHARRILADVDGLYALVAGDVRRSSILRLGAIDSAAAGLVPRLIRDLRLVHPDLELVLVEDKTVRLVPKLLRGEIDLALVRPPERIDPRLVCRPLFDEHAVVALPSAHPLAAQDSVAIADLAATAMILPSRRSRPHSHDLTVKLFDAAGVALTIAQEAEEKHTILALVGAGIGAAIVPRWSALTGIGGVAFRRIVAQGLHDRLPLAAMWSNGSDDPAREAVLACLCDGLAGYAATA